MDSREILYGSATAFEGSVHYSCYPIYSANTVRDENVNNQVTGCYQTSTDGGSKI